MFQGSAQRFNFSLPYPLLTSTVALIWPQTALSQYHGYIPYPVPVIPLTDLFHNWKSVPPTLKPFGPSSLRLLSALSTITLFSVFMGLFLLFVCQMFYSISTANFQDFWKVVPENREEIWRCIHLTWFDSIFSEPLGVTGTVLGKYPGEEKANPWILGACSFLGGRADKTSIKKKKITHLREKF